MKLDLLSRPFAGNTKVRQPFAQMPSKGKSFVSGRNAGESDRPQRQVAKTNWLELSGKSDKKNEESKKNILLEKKKQESFETTRQVLSSGDGPKLLR